MSENKKEIIITVRGIILNKGKMFVVKMPSNDYYCLPGGKLESGEDLKECLDRELIEELGVKPKIGRLMYINTFFIEKNMSHSVDFIFEITNGSDYVNLDNLERTHAFELSDMYWISKEDNIVFLPKTIFESFKNDNILTDIDVFVRD